MRFIRQLGIFLLLFIICGVLIFATYHDVESKTIAQVNSEQMVHAEQAAQGIMRFTATYNSTLAFLAGNDHIISMDQEGRHLMRDFYSAHSGEISSVTRMDENGIILYTYPFESSTGSNISAQSHVRKVAGTHQPVISDVFTSVQGFRTIAMHMPVFDNGNYRGSLAILIPFDQITGKYLKPVRILSNGYAWILSQNGVILYSPFPEQIDRQASDLFRNSPTMTAFVAGAMTGSPGTSSYTLDTISPREGPTTFEAVFLPIQIGDANWSVIVATPRSEILATLQTFQRDLMIIFGILVASLIFFTYYLMRARGIIKEEDQRRAAEAALRESEQNYRDILENMQDVFFRTGPDGRLVMLSPSGVKLLGYRSESELIGKSDSVFYANPDDRERMMKTLREKGSVANLEMKMRTEDGTILTVLTSSHTCIDAGGKCHGIEGIIRDITDRKRTENALAQATKKLNMLTAITLNDIRNALFTLAAYLELEVHQTTEEKRHEWREKETAILRQLNLLLNIARNYQSLGLNPPRWHNVNTTLILALSHLGPSEMTRNIEVGNLEIYADPLLEVVFLNLAENVVNHAPAATVLALRYEKKSAGLTLIFEDNGPGIPDDRKETIFHRGATTSSGTGLFMVREILEITGISIRETGTYGKGARFEMNVPREGYRFPGSNTEKER